MSKELIIYADESVRRGDFFSNFFGGVLIASTDLAEVIRLLGEAKKEEKAHGNNPTVIGNSRQRTTEESSEKKRTPFVLHQAPAWYAVIRTFRVSYCAL